MANNKLSTSDVLGQIGAAKLFAGTVSNAINTMEASSSRQVEQLEQQLAATTDEREKQRIRKRLRRVKSQNRMLDTASAVSRGATDFLCEVAKFCDIGKRQMIEWLSDFLVLSVPALEVAVKAVLVSNIKKMTSCALDPRIPDMWRDEGIIINEKEIDPRRILSSTPYSQAGRYNYFGVFQGDWDTTGVPLYALSRAQDMNAFIWFTKNCGNFASPNVPTDNLTEFFDCEASQTLYNTSVFDGKRGDGSPRFLPGSTFRQAYNADTLFICTDAHTSDDPPYYSIKPISDRPYGEAGSSPRVNWYKATKDPGKSRPIISVEYLGGYERTAPIPRGNFRVRILPKPFKVGGGFISELTDPITELADRLDANTVRGVYGGEITNTEYNPSGSYKFPGIQSPVPRVARFNGYGQYDKSGNYSINEDRYTIEQYWESDGEDEGTEKAETSASTYTLTEKTTGDVLRLKYDRMTQTFVLGNRDWGYPSQKQLASVLRECYFGNTVYELNYDYLMSFRLFDAKSISASIISRLLNICVIPNPFARDDASGVVSDRTQRQIDDYVDRMVEKIISEEEGEYTDCFYTFSNEEYEQMEKETSSRLMNGAEKSDSDEVKSVFSILDAYDADASLKSQTETLTRAFIKAAEVMDTQGSQPVGENGAGNQTEPLDGDTDSAGDFIKKAVKFLTSEIVNAILTPKVLMLIMVNKKLMGNDPLSLDTNYRFGVQDILGALQGMISGMIREVIDTIQKELLRIVLKSISEIMNAYSRQLAIEYAQKWYNLLRMLLACFKRNKARMSAGSGTDDGTSDAISAALDQVDYADIDDLLDRIVPNTNPC